MGKFPEVRQLENSERGWAPRLLIVSQFEAVSRIRSWGIPEALRQSPRFRSGSDVRGLKNFWMKCLFFEVVLLDGFLRGLILGGMPDQFQEPPTTTPVSQGRADREWGAPEQEPRPLYLCWV